MLCPRCKEPLHATLEQTPGGRVEIDRCASCHGIWFDAGELSMLAQLGNGDAFALQSPLLAGDAASVPCPRHPGTRMLERQLLASKARMLAGGSDDAGPLTIDQCPTCHGLWFDGGELDQLAKSLRDSRLAPFLADPEAMERPGSAWRWLFMLMTGLPIEQWQPRLRRPLAVMTLLAICVVMFLWQLGAPGNDLWVGQYGLVPSRLMQGGLPPLVMHMFMHGGLLHIIGNMYFLWVFGDNVEDRLGPMRFLYLYFAAGFGAALCHAVLTDRPDVPVLGASGAVAGVMAAYVVLFPQARIVSMILFFSVRWKTSTYLLVWLGYQVIGVAMGIPGIAWWAHIGGFVVGYLVARPFRLGVAQPKSENEITWPPHRAATSQAPAGSQAPPGGPRPLQWY
jgi:membrane associated rhomboid family serine protease/Zn-finger nucleic acid-binding protein